MKLSKLTQSKKIKRIPSFSLIQSILFFSLLMIFSFNLYAKKIPRLLGEDPRIRQAVFSPNEVYEVKATFGYQTSIEFSESEKIEIASIGDSIAWQVIPLNNRVFIKPVEENPKTNMTVVTNKRTYYFSLSTTEEDNLTYLIRFRYPELKNHLISKTSPKSSKELNFKYEIKNQKKSGLIRAFDDNEFTYLQFKETKDLPAIFWIDSKKKESLVNYRIEGPYVVIERVADRFKLRRGKVVGHLINKHPLSKRK